MKWEAVISNEEEDVPGRISRQEVPFLVSESLPAKASDWVRLLRPISARSARARESARLLLHAFLDPSAGELADIYTAPFIFSTPAPTKALDQLIAKSKEMILSLPPGWDDSDNPAYQAHTIERASDLLKRLAATILTRRIDVPLPVIRPADRGSIDLYWADETRTLLVNVPEGAGPATYAGRRRNTDTMTGTIHLDQGRMSHLASWLTE